MAGFLDLKRLRYFRAIAEHGSLSAAARALHLAQPALSHHVAELEAELGVKVLERRRDGVVPTEAGKLLVRHAIDIATRVEKAEAELRRFASDHGAAMRLRLAIISSLAADLTPVLVAALKRDMPEIVLRITETGTNDSLVLLERGETDLAIGLMPSRPDEQPVALEPLYHVSIGGGAPDPIRFDEVAADRLIMPARGSPLRSFIEETANAAGLTLNVVLEFDGAGPRRSAALAGLGSTIFGAHMVARETALLARPIIGPELHRPVYLGMRRSFDPGVAARVRAVVARALASFGGMAVAEQGQPAAG
jgi:LysR family transcriptional regulator, nitrogen assimilation regulatory protein